MNIQLCIAWFVFGFFVGQIFLIGLALIISEKKENRNGENKEGISEQSNNNDN